MSLTLPFPIEYWDDTDPFGNHSQWRKDKGFGPHRGDDWTPGGGASIPASGAGHVVAVAWSDALGWYITVEYDEAPGVFFSYCHLEARPALAAGSRFGAGVTLGHVGNTGTASYGPHLHLVASRSTGHPGYVVVVDPMQFFSRSSTAGGITLITSGETDMKHIYHPDRGYAIIWAEGAFGYKDEDIDAIVAKGIEPSIIYEHAWQWDTEVREANIRGDAMRALQTKHTLAALRVAGLPVDIDEVALGKQIAGLLPTPTADSIKIAKATADEIDARDRARLGK